jgi:outer membrane protein TolC
MSSAGLPGCREQGLMPIRQGSNGKRSDRIAQCVICLGAMIFAGGCKAPGSARPSVSQSDPANATTTRDAQPQSLPSAETTAKAVAATAAPGRVKLASHETESGDPLPDSLAVPAPTAPDDQPLPINLPTALQLANVRAVDVAAAAERIQVAAAQLDQAKVLWIPSLTLGGDYNRHDGQTQDAQGNIVNNSHSSGMLGLGTGMLNAGIISVNDAIFAPLAARQQVEAREADRQAASNDTLVAVSEAYFTVQQSRGELAGAVDATRRTEELIRRTQKLAGEVVPELELFRAETELARRQQAELFARERREVARAELLRVLHMDATTQVEPTEPPQLRVELVELAKPVDELIPIGLTHRPELASRQAQVQATLSLLKQERMRPLIPSVLLRGFSTPVTGTLGAGFFGGGANSSFGGGGLRSDFDLQLLWQLDNLGFGNRAKIQQRDSENRLAVFELFRLQDRVAAEVAQSYAQAQLAARRVEVAERGLKAAVQSADKNMIALGQTKGAGAMMVLLVRPQEVVAAIQAVSQANVDYFGAIADANRAQFRLYRALGQPAECLATEQALSVAIPADPSASAPPADSPEDAGPPVEEPGEH